MVNIMNPTELAQLEDPDLYAAELQHWLMTEGPRSQGVRQLMRLARRHPDAELERIFETKLAEYKRAHREDRVPTLWNLPLRGLEWLTDSARFTPPRDVLMTLVYVVIVLVIFEVVKGRTVLENVFGGAEIPSAYRGSRRPADEWDEETLRAPSATAEQTSRVDQWFVRELSQAAESSEFGERLARLMAKTIGDSQGARDRLESRLESQEIEAELQKAVRSALTSLLVDPDSGGVSEMTAEVPTARRNENAGSESRPAAALDDESTRIAAAVRKIVDSEKSRDALRQALEEWVDSNEFRERLSTALHKASPARPTPEPAVETGTEVTAAPSGGRP